MMKLARMNAGKPGRPFRILKVLLRGWLAIYTFLQMPYRQMEGFVRKLASFIPGLVAADYTTLFRRIRRLDLSLEVTPEKLTDSPKMLSPPSIAPGSRLRIEVSGCARSGGSGVAGSRCMPWSISRPTRFSAWRSLTNRYRMTRCSSCSSTKPKHHCGEEHQVIQALGDGAYDRNEIFNILERRGITSGIKTQDRCRDPLDRVTLSG